MDDDLRPSGPEAYFERLLAVIDDHAARDAIERKKPEILTLIRDVITDTALLEAQLEALRPSIGI